MFTISSSNPSASFDQIANALFNKYIIQVNDSFYRLLEAEFYYNDGKEHTDIYTHGHKWQKRSGYWYVHGSGIDITIGNDNASGGILLRSIQKLLPTPTDKKEQYTFGPLNVLTELISGFHNCFNGEKNIFSLVEPEEHKIKLEVIEQKDIIQCRRIGLSGEKEHKDSLYRYLIFPHLPHREKTKIAELLLQKRGKSKETLDEIKRLLGSEFLKKERDTLL